MLQDLTLIQIIQHIQYKSVVGLSFDIVYFANLFFIIIIFFYRPRAFKTLKYKHSCLSQLVFKGVHVKLPNDLVRIRLCFFSHSNGFDNYYNSTALYCQLGDET